MPVTFERAALYEEVWSEPLVTLAKKYGLSDNGLRKICKKMSIPLPSAGHWAKIAAGQRIERTPLPAEADVTSYRTEAPALASAPFRTPEDDAWIREQDALEDRPDGLIRIEDPPARWHKVASTLRSEIDKRIAEAKRWRELAEREAKRSTRQRASSPSFDSWHWKSFLRDGQLVMHAPLRVSQQTCERALRIGNALCYAAEARGFAVGLNVDKSRIELKGHGTSLTVRMSEKLDDKIRRAPPYEGGPLENMEAKVPTGSLKLFVGLGSRSEREVAVDDLKGKIESKLKNVFLRINRLVVSSHEQERRRDAWNREWKQQQARQAARALRQEKARKRRETLYREVQQWHQAETIRAYVAQVTSTATVNADDALLTRLRLWQGWAHGLADQIDPTLERCARLRSGLNRIARIQTDEEPE